MGSLVSVQNRLLEDAELPGFWYDGRGNGWDIRWPGQWVWTLRHAAQLGDEAADGFYTQAQALAELSEQERADGEDWASLQDEESADLFELLPVSAGVAVQQERMAA